MQNSNSITTEIVTPANPIRYELVKLIMVDSYTPGRITELPLIGGTAITGRNGRGKTSLLKLIPAFYGERLDRIVRPVSNQQNFARYYLPRSTSYIIYEYRRDDTLCCVILCADQSGDGVEYRFVSAAFQRSWFIHDDGTSFVTNSNVLERLKLHGSRCSRKMRLDEYRAIIQGKRVHGSDLKQHRRDVLEYSFCPSSQPLSHIERIVFGMFTRKADFKDLQRMIVASVTETTGQISLGTERKKIESWPDAYHSYAMVMAEANRMEEVEIAYNECLASEQELRNIYERFVSLDDVLRGNETEARLLQQEASESESLADRQHEITRRDITDKLDRTERAIIETNKLLQELQRQADRFHFQKIEEKAALVDRENEIIQSRDRLESRKSLLLNEQSNIQMEYSQLLTVLDLEQSERLRKLNEQQPEILKLYQSNVDSVVAESEQQALQIQESAALEETGISQVLEGATLAMGLAQARVEHPQPDSKFAEIVSRQEAQAEEARHRLEEADKDATAASSNHKKALENFITAELLLRSTQAESAKLEASLEALLQQASPNENSVLSFLRAKHPEWTQDIAKVLREDILTRNDLEPIFTEVCDSLYGLQINLDLLDAPLVSDETALQDKLDGLRREIKLMQDRVAILEVNLTEANALRLAMQNNADLRSAQLASARTTHNSALKALQDARLDVRDSIEVDRANARQAHLVADQAVQKVKAELHEHQVRFKQTISALRQRRDARKMEFVIERDNALAEVDKTVAQAVTRYESARIQIDLERITKLKENGVDTAALAKLDAELKTVLSELKIINDSRTAVVDWKRWCSTDWSRRISYQEELSISKDERVRLNRSKLDCMKAWDQDKVQRASAMLEIKKQIHELADKRQKIARHMQLFEPYSVSVSVIPQYDPSWQLITLIGQTSTQFGSIKSAEDRLEKEILAIKRAFTATRLSPPDQYFDTHRQTMGPDRAARPREWVPVFKAWYSSEHLQYKNILMVEAKTIAESVSQFRNRMEDFHRKVQQFNRELQTSLNANQGFESIEQLSVEIVSSIRDLGYWSTIEKLMEERNYWLAGEMVELPPPSFAIALGALLSHWHLKEGIQAELTELVRIQGEVVENNIRRPFKNGEDLANISSNGLSYIVMVLIFVGFINRVRGKAPVNVVWALDEIKDLDIGNVELLMEILKRNDITLVSACPDPDPDVLGLFKHRRSIKNNRFIYDPSASLKVIRGAQEMEVEDV